MNMAILTKSRMPIGILGQETVLPMDMMSFVIFFFFFFACDFAFSAQPSFLNLPLL